MSEQDVIEFVRAGGYCSVLLLCWEAEARGDCWKDAVKLRTALRGLGLRAVVEERRERDAKVGPGFWDLIVAVGSVNPLLGKGLQGVQVLRVPALNAVRD